MAPFTIGIIGVLVGVALMVFGAPMALVFLFVGGGGLFWLVGWGPMQGILMTVPFEALNSFEWSVIPLFLMMGLTIFESGIGGEIFLAMRNWLGYLPGGLAVSTVGACAALGTCTGSGIACTTLMAKVAYPEMRRFGYSKELSFGVIASSGTLAMIIPPSAGLVIYAILAEVSIGKMLIAGLIPGFLSALIYGIMIIIRVKLNPSLGQILPSPPWRVRFASLRYLLPAVITFIVIILGIYKGIFTPSEAAGVGGLVVFAVAFSMKRLTWIKVKSIFLETARLTVLILVILMSVRFFIYFLTYTGLTLGFIRFSHAVGSPSGVLVIMIFVTFIFGMFLGTTKMYLTVPIMIPILISLGYNPLWFGIVMIKMAEVGYITPPVAYGIFITQGIVKEVPGTQAVKSILPFLACDFITLALFIGFPQIITYLPNMMGR